ncbi:MAG: hypothetical protein WBC97_10375 [Gemmatimonadales bacterium]
MTDSDRLDRLKYRVEILVRPIRRVPAGERVAAAESGLGRSRSLPVAGVVSVAVDGLVGALGTLYRVGSMSPAGSVSRSAAYLYHRRARPAI